jgi:uncharacterized protein (DUF4415 family)
MHAPRRAVLDHLGASRAERRKAKILPWSRGTSPDGGKTDWAAVRNDPDAVPLDFDWSEAVLVIPPKKKAISIRLDEDVLDYFKQQGAGYQRRMNAVLRSYMQQARKSKKRA